MNIIVRQEGDEWVAYLEFNLGVNAHGRTEAEAIGNLYPYLAAWRPDRLNVLAACQGLEAFCQQAHVSITIQPSTLICFAMAWRNLEPFVWVPVGHANILWIRTALLKAHPSRSYPRPRVVEVSTTQNDIHQGLTDELNGIIFEATHGEW